MDFSQLLRLNDLVEHYQLHCQEAATAGEEVCLQDFLYDHFVEHNNHEHEDNGCSHDGLPMHSCSSSVLMAIANIETGTLPTEASSFAAAPSFKANFYSFPTLSGIDRPPC